jgi:uncharacterized protein (DUF302 family)
MISRYRYPDGPSGRHGGPCAPPVARNRHARGLVLDATHECFVTAKPYAQVLSRTRGAVSRHGLEILRECDVGSRIREDSSQRTQHCRVLYVTHPDLFATAISTHPSAALWLPLPLVVSDEMTHALILFPVEAMVRDRASLLGIREPVHKLYKSVTAALETVGERSSEPDV